MLHIFPQSFLTRFVLLGSLAIIALPMVVFAQATSTDVTTTDSVATGTATTSTTANAQEASATESPVPVTTTSTETTPSDSYRREELPNDDVFGDFVVGPGRFEVQVAPGDETTVELVVSNRMGEGKIFNFEVEDVTGSETGESVASLLGDEIGPYSLRDFIQVPHESFYLEHATRVRIPVTIALPPDAEPGGRYGSLLTTVTSRPSDVESESGAQPAAAVVSRVGTLFFVTTPGDIERESELQSFSTRNNQNLFTSGPVTFDIVMENSGSVHTSPSGTLGITNLLGEEVGSVEIDRWFVLPQSLRNREITWDRELLFGRYKATLELDLGHDDLTTTETSVFWVIPLTFVLAVFFGFLVLFLFFRFVFSRFEFKRKT